MILNTINIFLIKTGYAVALREMEMLLEEGWGVKNRTASGYATIIVCAKWIFDRYESHFFARGFTWDNFMNQYLIEQWAPAVFQ